MHKREKYEEITAMIRKAGSNVPNTDECVIFVADTMSTVLEGVTGVGFGVVNTVGKSLYYAIKGEAEPPNALVPNPWFVVNGHEDRPNPITERYLKTRNYKSLGGSALSLSGTAASAGTAGVNVMDLAIHGNALGSSVAHLVMLAAMASEGRHSKSITIKEWLRLIIAMKAAKSALRTGSIIGGAVPGAALPAGIATTVAKMGIRLTMTTACLTTAAAIHWRAYSEQRISGGLRLGTGKKVGPATRIYHEVFKRRGATRIFGQYDTMGLIDEPGGWLALSDKLLLL